MTIHLTENASKKELSDALKKVKAAVKRPLDVSKFSGKIEWGQDAVAYQRELRGE